MHVMRLLAALLVSVTLGVTAGVALTATGTPDVAEAIPTSCTTERIGTSLGVARCLKGTGQYRAIGDCGPAGAGPTVTIRGEWRPAGKGPVSSVVCSGATPYLRSLYVQRI